MYMCLEKRPVTFRKDWRILFLSQSLEEMGETIGPEMDNIVYPFH